MVDETIDNNEHIPDEEDHELEFYGDTGIASAHARVPRWLILTYIILPFWGAFWFYMFFNGSYGWLDRGYWKELQIAANTTLSDQNILIEETIKHKAIEQAVK